MKRNKKDTKGVMILIGLLIIIVLVFFIGIYTDKKNSSSNQKMAEEYNQKMYEELFKKAENDRRIKESLPRIICWGDSLTAGVGGNGVTYPNVLADLIKLKVINLGVGGEETKEIAIRQGAISVYTNELVIPKDIQDVEISLYHEQGESVKLGIQGDSGLNPCEINGVVGEITYNSADDKMYFRRKTQGSEVTVENGTQLITEGMKNKNSNDILVIFTGSNDNIDVYNVQNIIDIQRQMIEYSGNEKYIIIGLTSKDYMSGIEDINNILMEEYGENFIDIKKYILENGLADVGIQATDQDKIDIENGKIPSSLRVDSIHGNSYFYRVVGQQVYNKIIQLGYINDEQKEYLGIN